MGTTTTDTSVRTGKTYRLLTEEIDLPMILERISKLEDRIKELEDQIEGEQVHKRERRERG